MVEPEQSEAGQDSATEGAGAVRAWLLGAAGLRMLVACPCGSRSYLSRRHWRRRGFTICDGCQGVILYATFEVLRAEEAEARIAMIIGQEEEREALREDVERALRQFVATFDTQPQWLWAPATVKLVEAVRPKLELLGGPIRAAGSGHGAQAERPDDYEEGGEQEPDSEYDEDDDGQSE